MHVRRLFVYVATLRQPELVLCTSLTRCSPCSTADQLLGAHSTALSSISDADGRYHTVLQASWANMCRWGAQVLLLIMLVVRCYMPALLMVRECTCACGWAAHGMPRPNVRWNVVIDVPTVLLSAIKLAQSPTRVLGAVERQLAPPPLRAYILPLNNFSGSEPYRSFRAGSDRDKRSRSAEPRKDR